MTESQYSMKMGIHILNPCSSSIAFVVIVMDYSKELQTVIGVSMYNSFEIVQQPELVMFHLGWALNISSSAQFRSCCVPTYKTECKARGEGGGGGF